MSATIKSCLSEVAYNNTLEEEKTERPVNSDPNKKQPFASPVGNEDQKPLMTIAEAVRESVCLNDCSNSGICVNGMLMTNVLKTI